MIGRFCIYFIALGHTLGKVLNIKFGPHIKSVEADCKLVYFIRENNSSLIYSRVLLDFYLFPSSVAAGLITHWAGGLSSTKDHKVGLIYILGGYKTYIIFVLIWVHFYWTWIDYSIVSIYYCVLLSVCTNFLYNNTFFPKN